MVEMTLDGEAKHDHRGALRLFSAALVTSTGRVFHYPVRQPDISYEEMQLIENLPFSIDTHMQASSPSVVRNIFKEILREATNVIVFNEEHERKLFPFLNEVDSRGRPLFKVQDAMKRAAPYVKQWNPYFSDYEYPSLGMTASHFGLKFIDPGWHDAHADAQMTLDIWHYMERNPPFSAEGHQVPFEKELSPPVLIEHDLPF